MPYICLVLFGCSYVTDQSYNPYSAIHDMGMFILAVGYEISSDTLDNYLMENDMLESESPDYEKFLIHLESEISTMVHLAFLDDESGSTSISRQFLCCYADYRDRVYDFEEIMAIDIPNGFTRIPEIIETKGTLKRVFAPKGILHSYDRGGMDRVQACGLVV
jgi:hypothetical protein